MNFKQIEISGFKSFADPTKIKFEEGINAIVGPNGCGKSNVADAVKWVLGEQSSKNLRGTTMQDVIFKGTEKRKGSSFCEVSLVFDNGNKIFNTPLEEITITRKLYRSGVSEYLVNGNPCRLKDITEMLYNSGVGKSGYSIISQGMVDKIVNSKPLERRVIFEEASGIAGFKAKKDEAERNLERTQQNLDNITNVLNEIDRQLKPLQKQSETAKIYLELKEKLKLLEVNAYIYQYDSANDNKAVIQARIDEIMEDLNLKQEKLEKVIDDYNSSFDKLNHLDENIKTLNAEILDLTIGLEKSAGLSSLLKEKIRSLMGDEARLSDEISKKTSLKEQMEERLKNSQIRKEKFGEELNRNRAKLTDLEEQYENVTKELALGEDEAKTQQKRIFESLNKLGDTKAKISALNAEKTSYEENTKRNFEDKMAVVAKINELETAEKECARILKVETSNKEISSKKIDILIAKQNEKLAENKKLELDINSLNTSIVSLHQKKKLLEDMQKEFEGFNGSVRRLLKDAERMNELKKRIVGVVANLISVPEKYQTAIEMALGNAVQNIVTENEEDAKYLIKYLKENQYGRITCLPINKVKQRNLDPVYQRVLNSTGCFGVAKTLIKYNSHLEPVISSLLGTTVVVSDINEAVTLANKTSYSFRIVTLDGDIIAPTGSMTGGSKKSFGTSLLSKDSDIGAIIKEIEEATRERNKKDEDLKFGLSEYEAISKELKQETSNLREYELACAKENEIYVSIVDSKNDNLATLSKLEGEIAKATQILDSINKELSVLNGEENGEVATDLIDTDNFGDLKDKKESLSNEITELKVNIASISNEMQNILTEIERLEYESKLNSQELEQLVRVYENNNALLKEHQSKVTEIDNEESVVKNSNELSETKAKLKKLEDSKGELQASLKNLDEERLMLTSEVSGLQDKKYAQDLNLTKVDTDIEAMQERVWSEYELTYATALDYKKPDFDLKLGLQDITKTKKEISALGNVNVNAIEDYKLLQERHGGIYEQAQDLIKAEEDIKKIIKDLSDEMTTQFVNEFNKINTNFGSIFKELFGGGNARLELVDSDNVLEAGVEIYAEPPEKKLKNTQLLSGGEKALVAIAILFAILRLKPMPFCLLDEIEAPLDEANVFRFVQYLRRYAHETQFICITHKKPTMENSDCLFGITMEEKGVSKVVSVKLSDAVKMAEVK